MSDTATKFDPEWCCWAADGWGNAGEGSVRDARRFTRAQAQSFFAREASEGWVGVRVWKRYLRPCSRQEQWEWHVETNSGWDDEPETPPESFDPTWHEDNPSWTFVHRSHPEAVPVWICGFKGDRPPHNPPKEPRDA